MDFSLSTRAASLQQSVRTFIADRIAPMEAAYFEALRRAAEPWQVSPQIEALKTEARTQGLWNLFLPSQSGLSVAEYACLAEEMGHSALAPEVFNCNAPDTGNMEVLEKFGSEAQQAQWLEPLLRGEVRSAFCMTEPDVASSDATNIRAEARLEGDEVVLNGHKWWSTGIGHPRCEVLIFMGRSFPDAPRHQQHTMVLVPRRTPGVRIERMLSVFGDEDPPYGHGEVTFTDVRLPADNIIAGPGRGFEIAQGRLGPGRIHHCMRCIGAAERALALMVSRGASRTAFGRPLLKLGANAATVAEARIAINQARLLTLYAAWKIDTAGVHAAMSEISQIKVVAPRLAAQIIDQAIQMHGGAGLSTDVPLAAMYAQARLLRIADGPDEVHQALVARAEFASHERHRNPTDHSVRGKP